jgi:hypothetical protein
VARARIGQSYTIVAFLIVGLAIANLWYFVRGAGYGNVVVKGGEEPTAWIMIGLMYVAMILGIVAQSFYFGETAPPSASWIKPTLASPIIFIPLLSSYQSSLANMTGITVADLMILLVSFQNGFFWKVVFDNQAEAVGKQKANENVSKV